MLEQVKRLDFACVKPQHCKSHLHTWRRQQCCADTLKDWRKTHTCTHTHMHTHRLQDHKPPPASSLAGAELATRYLLRSPAEVGVGCGSEASIKSVPPLSRNLISQQTALVPRGQDSPICETGRATCCHTLVTTPRIRAVFV